MTRPEPLKDTWYSRDLPVLHAVARRVEDGESPGGHNIAADLDMTEQQVDRSARLLEEGGYLTGSISGWGGGTRFGDLTPKGRREVGLWPSADVAADRLMAALQQAIDASSDEKQRTRLEKVRDGLAKAGRDVVVSVASGVLTGQIPT